MPQTHRFLLHRDGPALWAAHKPLAEVLELKHTTPAQTWEGTFQGNPTAPGGVVFKRKWFRGAPTVTNAPGIYGKRFDARDSGLVNLVVARWISWDTALKDDEDNAYNACTVGELTADYRMLTREVWREHMEFPELTDAIERFARIHNADGKLRGVLIEDKASGTSAYQTLMASAKDWLKPLLVAFQPIGDKVQRATQASVWCANGSVLLPQPSAAVPWLQDFEDELFTFPGSKFKDMVDSFAQLILFIENLLAEGLRARASMLGAVT